MKPVPTIVHFAVIGVVALVALIFQFGYPLLICLAVAGAFLGIAMIVVLTALDLVAQGKPRQAAIPRRAAAQAA